MSLHSLERSAVWHRLFELNLKFLRLSYGSHTQICTIISDFFSNQWGWASESLWARDFLWEKLVFQQAAAAKRAFLLPAFLLTAARRLSKCSDTTVHCLAPFFSRQDYGGKNSLTFQSHFPLYVKWLLFTVANWSQSTAFSVSQRQKVIGIIWS